MPKWLIFCFRTAMMKSTNKGSRHRGEYMIRKDASGAIKMMWWWCNEKCSPIIRTILMIPQLLAGRIIQQKWPCFLDGKGGIIFLLSITVTLTNCGCQRSHTCGSGQLDLSSKFKQFKMKFVGFMCLKGSTC